MLRDARPSASKWPSPAGRHRVENRVGWVVIRQPPFLEPFAPYLEHGRENSSSQGKASRSRSRRAEGQERPKKAAAAKKAPVKRKSRAKSTKVVRMKAFWGVFNQSLKRVALYEFSEKKEADKKAKELTASGKSPHFVQPVKEVVQE